MIKEKPFTMSLQYWKRKNPKNEELLNKYTEEFRVDLHKGNVLEVNLYDEDNKAIQLFLRRSTKVC